MIEQIQHPHDILEIIVSEPSGFSVSLLNVGATLHSWKTPNGVEIVARYQSIDTFLTNPMFLGCTVGPTCGRIRNGVIRNDDMNIDYPHHPDVVHHLHSGKNSYAYRLFDVKIISSDESKSVILFHLDDPDEFSNIIASVDVTYEVSFNHIRVSYHIASPVLRPFNLTNHAYFNLDGDFDRKLTKHILSCDSSNLCLVDEAYIPKKIISTSSILPTLQQGMDLSKIIHRMNHLQSQCQGIDHYILFSSRAQSSIKLSSLSNHTSITIHTSYPGVTVYSGNFPTNDLLSNNHPLAFHGAVCMEPSFMPNAYNDGRFEMGLCSSTQPYEHFIEYLWEDHL